MANKNYYKLKDGSSYLCLTNPLTEKEAKDYVKITEEEFNQATTPVHQPHRSYEPSPKRLALREINKLKCEISKTDYVACKLAECETDEEKAALREEYADVLNRRKAIRVRINELEASL